MKNLLLLSLFLLFFGSITVAQVTIVPFDYGVRWGFQVLKPGEYAGYRGKQVQAVVMYKDKDGNVVYTENHEGTLDDFSFLRFTVGHGTDPIPAERIKPEKFKDIVKLCATVTVQTDEGPRTIMVEEMLASVPRSNVAAHALNTEAVAGYTAAFDPSMSVEEFIKSPPNKNRSILGISKLPTEAGTMNGIALNNFVHTETAQNAITKLPQEYIRLGSGSKTPVCFGGDPLEELENALTILADVDDYLHGLLVEILEGTDDIAHSPGPHNTAAIYANNSARELSAGVLALAQTWGVFGTAQNGTVGVTNGLNNGAGATGFVGQAPDAGGFKYGLYGTSNSQASSWGLALFGNGFHTGTWTMSSDARMKTEVRTQSGALDRIMQLRPAQYKYRQDTPYSLPEGIHHGFIAQEMEEVFPELVSDITMPLSMDPQNMHSSGTTQYKAINYIEIIAILTSAVQELNTALNVQKTEIAELRDALQHLNGKK